MIMRGSRGGDRGSGPPLKNHKNLGFLSDIVKVGPPLTKSSGISVRLDTVILIEQ